MTDDNEISFNTWTADKERYPHEDKQLAAARLNPIIRRSPRDSPLPQSRVAAGRMQPCTRCVQRIAPSGCLDNNGVELPKRYTIEEADRHIISRRPSRLGAYQ